MSLTKLNKQVTRYNPALGRPDVTPYAMMMTDPRGGWVSYEDYMKLMKAYDEVWEELGVD